MLFFAFAFCLLIVLPLVLGSMAILTEHQRKMVALRPESSKADGDRLQALERRVAELTEIVHEQTLALDSTLSHARPEPIRERVGRSS